MTHPPPPAGDDVDTDRLVEPIRQAQRGDAVAMNEVLDELIPLVTRICGPIALARGADAAQESLIVIFRNLHTLREPSAWRGWVVRIATREAIRIARTESRTVALPDEIPAPASRPEALGADIAETLSGLAPEHRAILVLRDLLGYPEDVAARLLAIPPGTAKSRLHRARALFRKAWQ